MSASEFALPHIPDNLSIPQFFLDTQHAIRPSRPQQSTWFIEDATSRKVGYEEVRDRNTRLSGGHAGHASDTLQIQSRVRGLANALSTRWNIGEYSYPPYHHRS